MVFEWFLGSQEKYDVAGNTNLKQISNNWLAEWDLYTLISCPCSGRSKNCPTCVCPSMKYVIKLLRNQLVIQDVSQTRCQRCVNKAHGRRHFGFIKWRIGEGISSEDFLQIGCWFVGRSLDE